MIQEALALAEEVRQERGHTEEQMTANVGSFLAVRLGINGSWNQEDGVVDWGPVKDGQIGLLANALRDTLRNLRDAQSTI